MGKKPKSSYELAMERLRAEDPAGAKKTPLRDKSRRTRSPRPGWFAASRLAEREILFKDALKTDARSRRAREG